MNCYPTDLNDSQWQVIEKCFSQEELSRKRDDSLRTIWNALFYLTKTGCQWRMLPTNFPKWKNVSYYFYKWRDNGTFDLVVSKVREFARLLSNRKAEPTAGIMDSQSVKMSCNPGMRGIDANKKVNGRKRHIITDTQGFLLAVLVHPANMHDSKMALLLLRRLKEMGIHLKSIFADGGYVGSLQAFALTLYSCVINIVMRSDQQKGFVPLPRRWVVERTFAWFNGYRRLSKDYEVLPESSETFVQLAALRIMLNRVPK
jgi:putative transposase